MSAVSRYGATMLTGNTCGPVYTPALWMTASIRPRRFTPPATPRVCSRSDRSPTTAAAPRSTSSRTAVSRSLLRAWTTTSCPSSSRVCAAARPRPSAEPVMNTRPIAAVAVLPYRAVGRSGSAGVRGLGRAVAAQLRHVDVAACPGVGRRGEGDVLVGEMVVEVGELDAAGEPALLARRVGDAQRIELVDLRGHPGQELHRRELDLGQPGGAQLGGVDVRPLEHL